MLDTLSQPHQPKKPIPPKITRLTGITDADVAGHPSGHIAEVAPFSDPPSV
ncbi:hypothetical protein MEX01_48120 [Methylorubrum extorquens]|uniref:hypothetical protein n=1 Tax=Methylorubrum extorquens TaxID=408 RepID=UPI0011720FBE|nr:hypothetical protein [Methylorubrum extorquens]GEL44221.1 hypothetical protein MEX01_48120 [Methylorubrum extorquens]